MCQIPVLKKILLTKFIDLSDNEQEIVKALFNCTNATLLEYGYSAIMNHKSNIDYIFISILLILK